MMLGSACSPCCSSCALPAEIPVSFSWNLSSVASYKWFSTLSFSGGYSDCENTATIAMYATPNLLFANTPAAIANATLTESSSYSGGTIRNYSYSGSYTLSGCCNSAAWNDWVSRFPNWAYDSPTWKRLSLSQVTVAYSTSVSFYAKEYGLLSSAFNNAIAVIQARGDALPGTPCGLATGTAFMRVHAQYDNGECKLYDADFQLKGTGSSFGVPYPETLEVWPQEVYAGSDKLKPRYVAYGVQGGRTWFSSDLEFQFSAYSSVGEIAPGNYMYAAGANTLALI